MVETLIYHGKLANQIARLAAIVVKNGFQFPFILLFEFLFLELFLEKLLSTAMLLSAMHVYSWVFIRSWAPDKSLAGLTVWR